MKDYVILGEEEVYTVEFYKSRKLLRGVVNYEVSASRELQLNRERFTVVGREKTVGVIKARYGGLTAEKTVVVTLPLKAVLLENKVVLPLGQTFQLNVLGGCQEYRYTVDPAGLADIGISGLITTKSIGSGIITITDKKDPKNLLQLPLSI